MTSTEAVKLVDNFLEGFYDDQDTANGAELSEAMAQLTQYHEGESDTGRDFEKRQIAGKLLRYHLNERDNCKNIRELLQ